ncbi:MAG TPA: S9 family peptidase [Thermoanaerobaculia bacterium]|nr:S9 family peptidase [Thermoanaerobaculia bacterium]
MTLVALAVAGVLVSAGQALGSESEGPGEAAQRLQMLDVFELEQATDPRISPDGRQVVYVRSYFDIGKDRERSNLWLVDVATGGQRPLTSGAATDRSPRFSADGQRLLYVSDRAGGNQLWVRYLDSGETAQLTHLPRSPGGIAWSPDGKWIAFTMLVPEEPTPLAQMPKAPPGAEWAPPPRVIEKLGYRTDGGGYLPDGWVHLFVLPAEGGSPRQLTSGSFHHGGQASWLGRDRLVVSANRHPEGEFDPQNSELYEVRLDGTIRQLTDRQGPDFAPSPSPDGSSIAYLGYDDRYQGYQVTRLYLLDIATGRSRVLTPELDRDVAAPRFAADGRAIYFQYDEHGETRIGRVDLAGELAEVAGGVGGTSLDRPYTSGSFTVSPSGVVAFTATRPDRPADIAVVERAGGPARVLTAVNEDVLAHRALGTVEERWWTSSHDGRRIQGWVVRPPGLVEGERAPLVLEIHGGPFAAYGPHFAADIQLYAAAGYAVLYANPRGSTSYGEEFGNLIHHAYPGHDYDDLMSGVDALVAEGWIDPERLFVTGGSGGGVLTSWIVGKTDRFRAAAVQKPVINWLSFALTADQYAFFYRYWFPGLPWDHADHYWKRSPLSLVGNVTTPTLVVTGEADYRTPMSESEQYYQALQLRRVPSALVRIPEASHDIAARPSQLIAKVAHVLAWFERHGGD